MGTFKDLGVGGAAGFLLGLLGLYIIEPNTKGGTVLVVAIGIAVGVVLGGMFALVWGRTRS